MVVESSRLAVVLEVEVPTGEWIRRGCRVSQIETCSFLGGKQERRRGKRRKAKEDRRKRQGNCNDVLISNEAAKIGATPAHTTHQTPSHQAASERLAPRSVALIASVVGDVHGDGLGAHKRVLPTAAHGRVERTCSHIVIVVVVVVVVVAV